VSLYYQDDYVTLYHGDSFEAMEQLADESIDCVITDPPYSERTHQKASKKVSNGVVSHGITTFDAFTDERLYQAYDEMARITKGWVVSTVDYNHAFRFEQEPPNGMRQMRIGVWVKNNPTPQISGDRPAQGWEAISYLYKTDKRGWWNAGGAHGNYVSNLATPTGHPTPKPISMVSSFVERFSNPNELILDPFAGGGTTLVAARNLGRKAIGVELEEKYCELIAKRLSQDTFDFSKLQEVVKETYTQESLI
jgi:site-specific DNA-methyltransferase (adenine-specific)